jgi:RNA recognition motif-containing protein
MGPPQLG